MSKLLKIKDLQSLLAYGKALAVEFGPRIEDAESYPEPGMRAMALRYTQDSDPEVCRVEFDFSAFDEHNKALESANYYDKKGVPCLTARQAGSYKPVADVYFTSTDEMAPWFTPLANPTMALYEEFLQATQSSGPGTPAPTYVAWLEAQLLQSRQSVRPPSESVPC